MANYEKQLFELGQIWHYLGKKGTVENLTEEEQKRAFSAFALGLSYYEQYFDVYHKKATPAFKRDPRVVDSQSFREFVDQTEFQQIRDFFEHLSHESEQAESSKPEEKEPEKKEESKETEPSEEIETPLPTPQPTEGPVIPQKEDSTVPAELETLVAQYKLSQAEQLETDNSHSVADAVKRARATWEKKNRIQTILQNRSDLQKEEAERFFVDNVKPKAGSREAILEDIDYAARQAVIYQAAKLGIGLKDPVIEKAISDLVDLGISGSVDLTDFNDLNVVSQLVFKFEGKNITSPINEVDDAVLAWQHAVETEPYSDTPDKLEQNIFQAEKPAQEYLSSSSFIKDLEKNNPDFADNAKTAQLKLEEIQNKLLVAIPNPSFPQTEVSPLRQHATALENALRQVDPQLRINPNEVGSQTIGLLQVTHGENRNISPEAVRLFSLGLTPEKLAAAEATAKDNPNSPLGKILFKDGKHTDVYDMVHHQIGKIAKSKLGQEIAEKNKALSGISQSLNSFYNNNPTIRVAKGVIDPLGTAKAWAGREAGRQIGRRLIENSSSQIAQQLGNFIVEHGLQNGISAFSKAAAKQALVKVATWAALKLGISLTAESLNAILPGLGVVVDIAAQVLVWVTQKTIGTVYNGFQNLAENVYGEKIKARDLLAPLVGLGGLAAAALGGLVVISRTVQVAVVSAVGILIGAAVTIGLYLGFAYLVAPMLSTLVQFDSVEKVNYANYETITNPSSDCGWPTKGHYSIVTGPNGGTHHRSHLEAIDIAAPGGSPHLSATTGVVIYTGVYSNYGNTVHVQTKNSAGSFVVIYGHLTAIFVSKGQQIAQGKPIGIVGGSGGWTPHIHMEYKGIKYNQCPAGGLKIKDGCCTPYPGGICTGACNAFSN